MLQNSPTSISNSKNFPGVIPRTPAERGRGRGGEGRGRKGREGKGREGTGGREGTREGDLCSCKFSLKKPCDDDNKLLCYPVYFLCVTWESGHLEWNYMTVKFIQRPLSIVRRRWIGFTDIRDTCFADAITWRRWRHGDVIWNVSVELTWLNPCVKCVRASKHEQLALLTHSSTLSCLGARMPTRRLRRRQLRQLLQHYDNDINSNYNTTTTTTMTTKYDGYVADDNSNNYNITTVTTTTSTATTTRLQGQRRQRQVQQLGQRRQRQVQQLQQPRHDNDYNDNNDK